MASTTMNLRLEIYKNSISVNQYLELNGTTNNLLTPKIRFDYALVTFVAPTPPLTGTAYYLSATNISLIKENGTNNFIFSATDLQVDGVPVTSGTPFITYNKKIRVRVERLSFTTFSIGTSSTSSLNARMNVYNVAFIKDGVTAADYNIFMGTLVDRKAAYTPIVNNGAVWKTDASKVSVMSLRQEIKKTSFTLMGLTQTISKLGSVTTNTVQQIYKSKNAVLPLTQQINVARQLVLNLKQTIFKASSSLVGLTQEVWKQGTATTNTVQWIYKASYKELSLTQQICAPVELLLDLRQEMYKGKTGNLNFYIIISMGALIIGNLYVEADFSLDLTVKGGVDVTALDQNISIFAGDTKFINFTIDGMPSLSGVIIKWGVRNNCHSTTNVLLKTTNFGIEIDDLAIKITLDPIDTEELSGTYYHEAELTDGYGNVSTIFTGNMKIIESAV